MNVTSICPWNAVEGTRANARLRVTLDGYEMDNLDAQLLLMTRGCEEDDPQACPLSD